MYRLIPLLFLFSCSSFYIYSESKLDSYLEKSSLFENGFVGFSIYDLDSDELIYACNENRYFIPASTAKLFTFYTSLKLLPDSLIGLRYSQTDSTIIFQGTADPSFLNSELYSDKVLHFLNDSTKKLIYSPINLSDEKFGSGWAWDDFNYSFQAEKSTFPIYGNTFELQSDSVKRLTFSPHYFSERTQKSDIDLASGLKLKRNEIENIFSYKIGKIDSIKTRKSPFIYSDSLFVNLLQDTLNKPITISETDSLLPLELKSISRDSALKFMMTESDNFTAEQLTLINAYKKYSEYKSKRILTYLSDSLLSEITFKPRLVDGSGLSRYNLVTPSTYIYVLKDLYSMVPQQTLFSLLATNGKEGTLKKRLDSFPPILFGKTGTVSNNHSLIGYLKTKSGKTLAFSLMINHFRTPLSSVRNEMDRLLADFYLYYDQ